MILVEQLHKYKHPN